MTTSASQPPRNATTSDRIDSRLTEGRQRFLAQVVAHGLASGRRTAKDFMRHFSPKAIMMALADHPRLRANLVVTTIGINEKVALKKSPESTGEDLQIALEEGVTDEESIVALFDPDDRVRYLDETKLWAFVAEGDFWKTAPTKASEFGVAKQHLAFILDCARANGLVTDHDIIEGCTLERLLDMLPKAEISRLLQSAVTSGRHGQAFDDEKLMALLPPSVLFEHVPLALVWEGVVVPRVAVPHGFAVKAGAASASPQTSSAPAQKVADASAEGGRPDDDEIVIEIVESRLGRRRAHGGDGGDAPGAAGGWARLDLSELKGEINEGSKAKN